MRRCNHDPTIPNELREVIITGKLTDDTKCMIREITLINTPGYILRAVDSGQITTEKGNELSQRYIIHRLRDYINEKDKIYKEENSFSVRKFINKFRKKK